MLCTSEREREGKPSKINYDWRSRRVAIVDVDDDERARDNREKGKTMRKTRDEEEEKAGKEREKSDETERDFRFFPSNSVCVWMCVISQSLISLLPPSSSAVRERGRTQREGGERREKGRENSSSPAAGTSIHAKKRTHTHPHIEDEGEREREMLKTDNERRNESP